MTPKRQKFYTENPYYTLFLADKEEKDTCYQDPETGQWVCEIYKEEEPKPLPSPPPDEEPSGDEPPPERLSGMLTALLKQVLSQAFSVAPETLPEPIPFTHNPIRLKQADTVPQRSVLPAVSPSERVNRKAAQSMAHIRKLQEARLQQALEQPHAYGNPALLQGLIQAYGPSLMPEETASTPEVYDVPSSPSLTASVQQLLNPGSNANSFIYEDPGFIQGNLAYAQSPHTLQAQLRQRQAQLLEQERFEMQQALLKEQIDTEKARQRAINLQAWFNTQKDGATHFAQNAYDFVIGDDVKTLQDPNASPRQKALSAGSLIVATNPAGAAEKTAVKALWKWLLAALAAAGIYHAQKKKLHLSKYRQEIINTPVELEDKGQNDNPRERKCEIIYARDIRKCEAAFPFDGSDYNRYHYKRCEKTAEIRRGECRHQGKPITPLDLYKD